jgi:acyl carrier protein
MDNRLKKVLSEILDLHIEDINDKTSQNNVEQWDSLKQINLVIALEEEFEIQITDDSIQELIDYKSIKEIVQKQIL